MPDWLMLALLAIKFGTFRFVDVLYAALLLCGAPTLQILCPVETRERPMMPARENGRLLAVALALCV
jgi:hypothetical protein